MNMDLILENKLYLNSFSDCPSGKITIQKYARSEAQQRVQKLLFSSINGYYSHSLFLQMKKACLTRDE